MRRAMLIGMLLVIGSVAPARAQEAPVVIVTQSHNPAAAGIFSALIPGAGQAYNGQWGKAVFFTASVVGLVWGADVEYGTHGCEEREECLMANSLSGAALATWVIGIVDAARTARGMNARTFGAVRPTATLNGRVGLAISVPTR